MRKALARMLPVAALLSSAVAWAASGPVTSDLEAALAAAGPADEVAVIVSYRPRVTARSLRKSMGHNPRQVRRGTAPRMLREAAEIDGQPLADLAREGGARDVRQLWIAGAVANCPPP